MQLRDVWDKNADTVLQEVMRLCRDIEPQLLKRQGLSGRVAREIYSLPRLFGGQARRRTPERAARTGRLASVVPGEDLEYDPLACKIVNNDKADALLRRTYRKGWTL